MGETEPADELALLRAEIADGAHDLSNALGAIGDLCPQQGEFVGRFRLAHPSP